MRSVSWWSERRLWLDVLLPVVLLVVPVMLGVMWGPYFDDDAYVVFRCARNLAAGELGPVSGPVAGEGTLLKAPLYTLVLWLAAELGASVAQTGLVLSALGWGATAVAMYGVGRAMRRPVAAMTAATLTAFSPLVVSTLGTEVSWVAALAWIAVAAAMRKRWKVQAGVVMLLACMHFDWITLATVAFLVVMRWIETRRLPVWPALILTSAATGWGLMVVWRGNAPFWPLHLNLSEWEHSLRRLVDESEFYCLFLPLLLCGGVTLLPALRKVWGVGLLWGAWVTLLALDGGDVARAAVATQAVLWAGPGPTHSLGVTLSPANRDRSTTASSHFFALVKRRNKRFGDPPRGTAKTRNSTPSLGGSRFGS